jgi:hypothetical protein
LKKTGQVNYIRSANGKDTVPVLRTNVPREGSKPDEICEHLCYTIQDYLQKGVDKEVFRRFVQEQKEKAEGEFSPEIPFDATPTSQAFALLFPDFPLSTVEPDRIDALYQHLQKEPKLLRRSIQRIRRKKGLWER